MSRHLERRDIRPRKGHQTMPSTDHYSEMRMPVGAGEIEVSPRSRSQNLGDAHQRNRARDLVVLNVRRGLTRLAAPFKRRGIPPGRMKMPCHSLTGHCRLSGTPRGKQLSQAGS